MPNSKNNLNILVRWNRTSGNLEIRCLGSGNHLMRVYSRNVLLLTSHVFPTQTKTRHQSHAFCQLFLCNILFFSKLFKKTSNFFLFHFVPPSTDRLVYFIDFNHDTKREIDFFILILSILVDTFISKISLPMQPVPEIRSISGAWSSEEAHR